jgi:hypothetical protein
MYVQMAAIVKEDWRAGLATISSQQSYLLDSGDHSDCTFRVGTDDEYEVKKFILNTDHTLYTNYDQYLIKSLEYN